MQKFKSSISRRNFIASAAASAAALAQPKLLAKRRIPIALELFSLRNDATKDLPGTLAAIAKMGYEGIELAGEKGALRDGSAFGRNGKELRKMLDDAGLKVFSVHHMLPMLQGGEFEKTVEFNRTLGNRRVTLAWLDPTKTIQPWYDYARQFNEIAAKLKKQKMQFAFHNHPFELDVVEGKRPWDVLFDNTTKDVGLQLHVAAFPAKGLDPAEYVRRYPGRVKSFHLNDYAEGKRGVLLGEGTVDFKKLIEAGETVGGVEVYIIEQESYPQGMTPVESVRRCLENFRKIYGARVS